MSFYLIRTLGPQNMLASHPSFDNKPDTEHVFNPDKEKFYNDTESTKARNPEVVMVEIKEDK